MPPKNKSKSAGKSARSGMPTILSATELPLEEISGLCLRVRTDGRRELCAIGDESFTMVMADLDAEGRPGEPRRHDLRALISAESKTRGGSQWEAIAADEEGRVFVLQENPGMVFVLDAALASLLRVIELRVDEEGPARDWLADENSRGEGIIPLANGHLLIVKEKRPPLFVEFGPKGASAQGTSPALLASAAFPLPAERRAVFVALQAWSVEGAEDFADLSDVAVGPAGDLYLLSDEERCLMRVDGHLRAEGGAARIVARWDLPKKMKKPEGLVILEDGSPIVAVDVAEGRENLFVLAPLPG